MTGLMCHFGQIEKMLSGKPVTEWKAVFAEARELWPCCADKVRDYRVYQYQLAQMRKGK